MYQTIEAIYEDGKIIPINEMMPIKKARVFITIVEDVSNEFNHDEISIKATENIQEQFLKNILPKQIKEFTPMKRDEIYAR